MIRSLIPQNEKSTYFIKFNVDGLLRGDYVSRMSGYATARQNGWMSANDIRELENLDLIPDEQGGNLYLINGSMLPLKNEEVLEVEEPNTDKRDRPGKRTPRTGT